MKSERLEKSTTNSRTGNNAEHAFFTNQYEDATISENNFFGRDAFIRPVVQRKVSRFLPEQLLEKMESSFGEDFSDVEIHENSNKADQLHARAFTQGNHIHFRKGEFNTASQPGEELIAHELAHVVQQRRGLVQHTHTENAFNVNSDYLLEEKADVEAKKAVAGEKIAAISPMLPRRQNSLLQKKSQAIQLWRDVPGQARIESTAPSTTQAWAVFMRAVRQASGQVPESELRSLYYNMISQRLRGSFQPISINAHTTDGYNRHWTGTIRFVFGDSETPLPGSGVGETTLSSASGSSQSLVTSNSATTGSSGGAEVTSTPGSSGGTGGSVSAGGTGSTTTGVSNTQGDTQTAGASSKVNQRLNRFSAQIGIEVNISARYDMGSSWTDWVNPFAYGSWGGASLVLDTGHASGPCGTVVYYKGSGIAR